MAVFNNPGFSDGPPVEIPVGYGLKVKNAGVTNTVCNRWRQGALLASRRDILSSPIALAPSFDRRRLIPFTAAVAALALLIGGVVWHSAVPTAQEALPASESPSK